MPSNEYLRMYTSSFLSATQRARLRRRRQHYPNNLLAHRLLLTQLPAQCAPHHPQAQHPRVVLGILCSVLALGGQHMRHKRLIHPRHPHDHIVRYEEVDVHLVDGPGKADSKQ